MRVLEFAFIFFFFLHLAFLRYDFCLLYGAFDAEFNWGRGLHTDPRQEPNWITCNGGPLRLSGSNTSCQWSCGNCHRILCQWSFLWQSGRPWVSVPRVLNPGSATPHLCELGQLLNLSKPLPSSPRQGLLITPSVTIRNNMFK